MKQTEMHLGTFTFPAAIVLDKLSVDYWHSPERLQTTSGTQHVPAGFVFATYLQIKDDTIA